MITRILHGAYRLLMAGRSMLRNRRLGSFPDLSISPSRHWCRIVMDMQTMKLVSALPVGSMKVLEISGDKWKAAGFLEYSSVSFPEYDICRDLLPGKYDLIVAEQVFEHLLWPYRAACNVFKMLEQGGHFLITTPFLIKIHNFPVDCTRWSPLGIKYFLMECGFDESKIVVGSWGNKECVIENFFEWKAFDPNRHSLTNEEEFPLVVWALATK